MIAVGRMLPDSLMPVRGTIAPTTLVFLSHGPECDGCRTWIHSTAADLEEALKVWEGKLTVYPAGSHHTAGLIIADRFGQVFQTYESGPQHSLPSPRELEEWLKFLGTLCPE